MREALHLAESVMYITAPNPRVACLIVRDKQLLASGATQRAGGPHAEVMALRQAAERSCDVAGSTVYVTLEPCSHFGRTPPRSEEHTSELQSLMRISYAVFCLKKKK